MLPAFQVDIPEFSRKACHELARNYPLLTQGLPMLDGVKH
jgi:acetylornithine deacetylase/succinyl-diaminopimelate desuccinylase-like protein